MRWRFASGIGAASGRRPGAGARPALRRAGWPAAAVRGLARLARRMACSPARGLAQDSTGGPLMEYAFVGPMFLALIIGIIQIALVAIAQQGLETAAETAARLIMTGQAQNYAGTNANGTTYTGMTASDFRTAVCSAIQQSPALISCDTSKLFINVSTVSSYAAATTSAPTLTYNAQGQVSNSFTYTPGAQGAVVLLRLMYLWPTATGPLGFDIGEQPKNMHLIYATSVLTTDGYTAAAS